MNRLQTGGIAHNMPIFSEVETPLGKQIDWICRQKHPWANNLIGFAGQALQ